MQMNGMDTSHSRGTPKQIKDKHPFELVPPGEVPDGQSILPNDITLKLNQNLDISISKHEARLCLRGHKRVYRIEGDAAFAPVEEFEYMRMMMVIAAKENLLVHQVDAREAFLCGEIDTEIDRRQPAGFDLANKIIYGSCSEPYTDLNRRASFREPS